MKSYPKFHNEVGVPIMSRLPRVQGFDGRERLQKRRQIVVNNEGRATAFARAQTGLRR